MRRINGVTRALVTILVAAVLSGAASGAGSGAAAGPLVVVVRHGGLCMIGSECKSVFRITDTTISDGHRSRPLSSTQRRALTSAIRELDAAYLRRHPFT